MFYYVGVGIAMSSRRRPTNTPYTNIRDYNVSGKPGLGRFLIITKLIIAYVVSTSEF